MIKEIQTNRILKTILTMITVMLLTVSLMTSIPSNSNRGYAAPAVAAVAPIAAAGWAEILALFGITVATGIGTYALTENYPYINDALRSFGADVSDWFNACPEDTYFTDGDKFYIKRDGSLIDVVDPSQLLIKASAIPTSYSFPVNIVGTAHGVRFPNDRNESAVGTLVTDVWRTYGTYLWYIPFMKMNDGTIWLGNQCFRFETIPNSLELLSYTEANASVQTVSGYDGFAVKPGKEVIMRVTASDLSAFISSQYTLTSDGLLDYIGSAAGYSVDTKIKIGTFYDALGNVKSVRSNLYATSNGCDVAGYMLSEVEPSFELVLDKDKLGNIYLSPSGSPEPPDDGDDDGTTYVPMLPFDKWEVFKSIADWLLNNGSNNGTTLGDYVNNNYNYNNVDVDINYPDRFSLAFDSPLKIELDADVNLSGGINLDITINDTISLPEITEGDGENFFSANVIDVFAGLTVNNPVMALLKELFALIDPSIVAIFSVSLSLMFLLALWKLIRG